MVNLFRVMRDSPGAYGIAGFTLAMGIGAVVAMFSIYAAVVINPMSVQRPRELVAIQAVNAAVNNVPTALSWIRFDNNLRHAASFSDIAAWDPDSVSLTTDDRPAEQLRALRVSSEFFNVLRVEPLLGRGFLPEDDVEHGRAVCVLSYELWQTRFGGAPMVGRVITLNGRPVEVVGIAPPRFTVPWNDREIFVPRIYESSTIMPENVRQGSSYISVIGRLASGVTLEQAQAELDGLSASYATAFGGRMDAANSTRAVPFIDALVGNSRATFLVLVVAVAAVLIVACANASTLFLGRLIARQRDTAVRQALGASRAAIVKQFLFESLGLACLAGVVGTGVAWALLRAVTLWLGTSFPQGTEFRLDLAAFGMVVGTIVVASLLVGVIPAIYVTRPARAPLVAFARGESSSASGRRVRGLLVFAEVAVSCVLLIGSTLLVVSLLRLQNASPGFETARTASGLVSLPPARYASPERQAAFATDVVDRVRATAGIRGAAAVFGLPLGPSFSSHQYVIAGQPIPPPSERERAGIRLVTEDYFDVMEIRLKAGRSFTNRDRAGAPLVCIVNETFAKRMFKGDPIGQSILRGRDANLRYEIVGVVEDIRTFGLRQPTPAEVFYPLRQLPWPQFAIVATSNADAATLRPIFERALAEVDPTQPLDDFATMTQRLAQTFGAERAMASITMAFAGIALLMALVGLYAVLTQNVAARRAEIGVRVALGAARSRVVGLVLKSGMAIVIAGVVTGVAAAGLLASYLSEQLYLVDARDPWIFTGVAVAFAAIGALACVIPSWRAARLDPVETLRRV